MNLLGNMQIPTSKLDLFIRSVEIASYLPGRVRLRSKSLIVDVKPSLIDYIERTEGIDYKIN